MLLGVNVLKATSGYHASCYGGLACYSLQVVSMLKATGGQRATRYSRVLREAPFHPQTGVNIEANH